MQRRLRLDARAFAALRSIDPSHGRLVIWVPGTNEREMPAGIRDAFGAVMRGAQLVRVPYRQTWDMRSSVPDGVRVLTDVLRGIADLRRSGVPVPGEIFLAGHSQGSWVGTATLATPGIDSSYITRAVFFANPGANPVHVAGFGPLTRGRVGRALELSNPKDPIALRARDVGASLDVVGGPELWRRVIGGLVSLVTDPGYAATTLGWVIRQRLTGTGKSTVATDPDPHLYTSQAVAGVRWLLHGNAMLPGVAESVASWGLPGSSDQPGGSGPSTAAP